MPTVEWRQAVENRAGRGAEFQDLMQQRVHEILLVSSPYDSFILEEDGRLYELMIGEFLDLNLRHTPGIRRVSSGAEALHLAAAQSRFNLLITTPHVGDMTAVELARRARAEGLTVPVILLAYDHRELTDFLDRTGGEGLEGVFLWQGDARILLAIVKYIEDKLNVAHDHASGVQTILVVEDNVRQYSSFLPVIYTELLEHSHRLISEGVNLSHKIMRMRARPKILLCRTFEEAAEAYDKYEESILGIVSDVEFPRAGKLDAEAGVAFARLVKNRQPDVPIVLHSSRPENAALAASAGVAFLRKGSPTLLQELSRFMVNDFCFGDFVFRLPDGREVDRAADLKELEEKLATVPADSIAYHGERNHFSRWLKARTEFGLAHELRPRRTSEFATIEDLRRTLIESIAEWRRLQARGIIVDFDRESFDETGNFHRIGAGSLGGKARGLAFVRQLLHQARVESAFPGVRISVPPAVVLGTEVFDQFLEEAGLRDFAIEATDDAEIHRRFREAPFPDGAREDLAALVRRVRYPIAVRSSSLLEDSQYQPFTGVYETHMLPNDEASEALRLERLLTAIRRVYASTFSSHTKSYLRATPYRLEEEKMAVIVQKITGSRHGDRFYPDFSGVARSHNFYPTPPLTSEDGIAAVCLGLGRTVVEGGDCLRFSPRYPRHLLQFSSVSDMLANSQRQFYALRMSPRTGEAGLGPLFGPEAATALEEELFGLEAAEADGTLGAVASTWSSENNAIYDGLSRAGVRLVSFAPILKHALFPLPDIIGLLLEIGAWGMSSPVEIEFAVNLSVPAGTPREFALLQMRPLALTGESEEIEISRADDASLICRSRNVLGHGRVEGLRDLVVVDYNRFQRSSSLDAARAVGRFNSALTASGTPYVLIGVGRWGSLDPWLGIPVSWDQISGARAIVEAGFRDFKVTPSQGSHFFQNLTSFNVGYFTVNPEAGDGFVAWDWLSAQSAVAEDAAVRHIRLEKPLVVAMNGRKNEGVILKPSAV